MATIYNIKIQLSSPWCSYDEDTIGRVIKKALEGLEVDNTNKLEGIEIEVKIKS